MARSITFAERVKASADAKSAAALGGWNTLGELRAVALEKGCSAAQFAFAVETAGSDPHAVANYLQRHAFIVARKIDSKSDA